MTATASPAVERDFRSDTVTRPLPEMQQASLAAVLGDSVMNEDATTVAFEQRMADLTGKPAALFCLSGTMSIQIGIRTHLQQPPYSVLCDSRAHIYTAEAAGLAVLSQAMVTPVKASNGVYLTLEDVQQAVILGSDIHIAPTRVISLENTLGGSVFPLDEIKRISEWAHEHNIAMHLDGARVWNAAIALDCPLSDICQYFDSISLCMSKGMCAPVGSVLVGEADYIKKATWFRKQQGGGIRQAGVLTAQCNAAIDLVWPGMAQTHALAKNLASRLGNIGIRTILPVDTNFVWMNQADLDIDRFRKECADRNVAVWGARLVLHFWTAPDAIDAIFEAAKASTTGVSGAYSTGLDSRLVYQVKDRT